MIKICKVCGKKLDETNFFIVRKYGDVYHRRNVCKDCYRKKQNEKYLLKVGHYTYPRFER